MIKFAVIVEDDPIISEMLESLLNSNLSVPVKTFSSVEQFLDSKMPHLNTLFIIDWNLPGIQGIELVKQIRKVSKISPIFIITGNFDHHYQSEGLSAGATDFLIKPFNPDHLMMKISNFISTSKVIADNSFNIGTRVLPQSGVVLKDGKIVSLTTREFEVFQNFYDHPKEIQHRSRIVKVFKDKKTTERNADVIISELRKKIKDIGYTISAIRGQGYLMEAEESKSTQ